MKLLKLEALRREVYLNTDNISYIEQTKYSCGWCDKKGHEKVYIVNFSSSGHYEICDCSKEAIALIERMIYQHSRGIE